MYAISTKVIAPTDTEGTMVEAKAHGQDIDLSTTTAWDYALNSVENQSKAVEKFIDAFGTKYHLCNKLAYAYTDEGMVWLLHNSWNTIEID